LLIVAYPKNLLTKPHDIIFWRLLRTFEAWPPYKP